MKYYLDTEFLEGTQKKLFGETKPTIDLISIGIVDEDGREFYAISKDFNLKEAWDRYEQRTGEGDRNNTEPRIYWIRHNVLLPIYIELCKKYSDLIKKDNQIGAYGKAKDIFDFNYKNLKFLINMFGWNRWDIANAICAFIYGDDCGGSGMSAIEMATKYGISDKTKKPEFYGYFADYDWVVFCWLFGKMNDLPKGFPMYCKDLKQIMDEKGLDKDWKEKNCPQQKEHHALSDAKWNLLLAKSIENLK